ncbi:MAG TPA: hypothetical protein VFS43_44135 [Polyangiaceae bacterium]|nr:hypothetical protein [Polyangiaceae bacterium]
MSQGRPKQGGRVELLLEARDERIVSYRMSLSTPAGEWSGRAGVELAEGTVQVEPEAGEGGASPPRWLVDFVRQLLRTTWSARRAEGASPWPERIARWRDERAPPGP